MTAIAVEHQMEVATRRGIGVQPLERKAARQRVGA